jgi:RNA polymerase sigma-70 factor (ECF subfamily)
MSSEVDFSDFLCRVRAGDEVAASELIRHYEPVIRREIRMRLHDPSLYRVMDSMDICQSVMKSFFVRAACGQFELNEPGQLLRLLVGMTRNKVAFAARKQRAQKRDRRKRAAQGVEELEIAGRDATPSRIAAGKELLVMVRDELTDEERRLADLRATGAEWAAIAAELGGTPDGRRVQLARALDRVFRELHLEDDHG